MSPARRFEALVAAERYSDALEIAHRYLRHLPTSPGALGDAGHCYLKLEQWEDARAYALKAYAIAPNNFRTLDTLAHACGAMQRWDEVRRYGRLALELRDHRFGAIPPRLAPWRISPFASRNIIAFSLFGDDPRYCEPAVLNALEKPRLYPGWTCRFYVDDSVPQTVRTRLAAAGAELVKVDARIARWPGPMWRLAAYDDPTVARVLFRGADSVISQREANAVAEWTASDCSFHVIRDSATHTELIGGGLWGARAGALPSVADMIDAFLARPVESIRFAEQRFLREMIWPYVRRSLLQHDSRFGFGAHRPFPDGPAMDDFHVGCAESAAAFTASYPAPDGTRVEWCVLRGRESDAQLVCAWPGSVYRGQVLAHIPQRYRRAIERSDWSMRIIPRDMHGSEPGPNPNS